MNESYKITKYFNTLFKTGLLNYIYAVLKYPETP